MTSSSTSSAAAACPGHQKTHRDSPSEPPPGLSPSLSSPSPARMVPIPPHGVDYRGKIVLAPMVRSGELPSRLLALHYGADLVWGPETIDRAMIGTNLRTNPRTGCLEWTRSASNNNAKLDPSEPRKESVIYRIDPVRERGKLIYQIGTASPNLAVQAASLVAPHVAGIDVNAGCPKPFSTTGGMGATLLRDPDRLVSILTSLVNEIGNRHQIGISVKIRLLETPELTSSLVHKLCGTGITGLTVHCRTTPMRPRERAIREQLSMIGAICHSHGVACLMNGDVTSREEGLSLAREYGVDGGMIATAAEANSSVFRPAEQGGPLPWAEVVEQYLRFALSVENKWGNTKFLLSQLMPGKSPLYQKVQMSKSYSECIAILGFTDQELLSSASVVDGVLGLDSRQPSKNDLKRVKRAEQQQIEPPQTGTKKQKLHLPEEPSPCRFYTQSSSDRMETPNDLEASEGKSRQQKAEEAAANSGFDGIGRGAMEVAA